MEKLWMNSIGNNYVHTQKCQFLSHQRGNFERLRLRLRLAGRAVAPTAKAQNFLSAPCLKKLQTFFSSYCLRTRSIDIVQNKYTNIDKSAVFYHAGPRLSRGLVKIIGEVGKSVRRARTGMRDAPAAKNDVLNRKATGIVRMVRRRRARRYPEGDTSHDAYTGIARHR